MARPRRPSLLHTPGPQVRPPPSGRLGTRQVTPAEHSEPRGKSSGRPPGERTLVGFHILLKKPPWKLEPRCNVTAIQAPSRALGARFGQHPLPVKACGERLPKEHKTQSREPRDSDSAHAALLRPVPVGTDLPSARELPAGLELSACKRRRPAR